jgi:hypothetical protein
MECPKGHAYWCSTSSRPTRERDIDVRLERDHDRDVWVCVLNTNGSQGPTRGMGRTAREAIMSALEDAGVTLSN